MCEPRDIRTSMLRAVGITYGTTSFIDSTHALHPTAVPHLLAKYSVELDDDYHLTMRADCEGAVAELLESALGDWLDAFRT